MKQYSFQDVVCLVNGVEVQGYGEGDEVLSMARINDSAAHMVGADGEMVVAISADRSGEVIMTLHQAADSNSFLSGLVAAQENGAFVPVFIQVKDTVGGDIVSGTNGYLKRPADMSRGTGVNTQEWVVVAERLDMLHLGN